MLSLSTLGMAAEAKVYVIPVMLKLLTLIYTIAATTERSVTPGRVS